MPRNPKATSPNANTGEIVAAFVAISAGDVNHAIRVHRHVFSQMGLAQREGDIVPGTEMLLDQRRQIDVRQKVATVRNKQLVLDEPLDVFDPAVGMAALVLLAL